MQHLVLLLILSIATLNNGLAEAANAGDQRPLLTLGYVEFPPYTYTDSNGKARGHLVELAKEMTDSAGYRLKTYGLPTRRMAQKLFAGKIDLLLGIDTYAKYPGKVLISKTVIDHLQLRAYRLKKIPPLSKKEELNGKKVVTLRGYGYGGWIDYITDPSHNIHHFIANDREQALRILVGRDADYLLDYKLTLATVLTKQEFPPLAYNDFHKLNVYIIVSAKSSDAEKVMRELEQAYLTLGDRNPVLKKNKLF